MKKLVFLMLAACAPALCGAQTYVYSNEWMYFDSLKMTVSNGHLLPGQSNLHADAVMMASGAAIYDGYSTSTFDLLYTIKDDRLYTQDASALSDLLYTVKNGKVYRGDSMMAMDCLFTYEIKSGKIYKGDSTFALDAVLWLQGDILSSAELCAVLLQLGYI